MTTAPGDLTPDLDEQDRKLTDRERRRWLLGPTISSPFDANDRLFPSFEQSGVFDESTGNDARDIKQMLRRDGRARSLEAVLTLPERSVVPEIREATGRNVSAGDARAAADLCRDNVGDWMRRLSGQATSSTVFRKAFFETTWEYSEGETRYESIEYRPPGSCQARFDPRSGKPAGFRQQIVTPDGHLVTSRWDETPGWRIVPQPRSAIFTHGTHREPLLGVSELDVCYWAWETRQKVLFLLFQYLESQSLPKLIAYGADDGQAQANADYLAEAKASSVLPFIRNPAEGSGAGDRHWDMLESSGKGADQFLEAVRYLEEQQVASVLAGFMNLTESAKSGGSFALSHDATEFFLQSRQAAADERAEQFREQIMRPLVVYNTGRPELTPTVNLGPLSRTETGRALELLKTLSTATTVNVPWQFLDDLTTSTATYLGLEEEKVAKAVREHAKQREEREAMAAVMQAAGPAPGEEQEQGPDGEKGPPGGPKDQGRAAVGDGVDTAFQLVRRVQDGQDPYDALAAITGPGRRAGPNPHGPRGGDAGRPVELANDGNGGRPAGAESDRRTGGMIALTPSPASIEALQLEHPDAEPPAELHLTLHYIGPDVTGWDEQRTASVREAAERAARSFEGPVTARVWAHAAFNPDGENPCAVYLVGDAESPAAANEQAREQAARERAGDPEPEPALSARRDDPVQRAHNALDSDMRHVLGEWHHPQHDPYVPHVTAGYGVDAGALTYSGPVTFDRLSLHLAGSRTDWDLADLAPDQQEETRGDAA